MSLVALRITSYKEETKESTKPAKQCVCTNMPAITHLPPTYDYHRPFCFLSCFIRFFVMCTFF